jgi:hypothetical protein
MRRPLARRFTTPFGPSNRIASCAGSAAPFCPASSTEHSLRIEPLDGGRSRFIESERFTGLLVGLVGGTLSKSEAGFEQMNTALKARVEHASPQS